MPRTPSPGPRERIVYATVQQLRRDGVTGTGLRSVVEAADAPRGSLQHYFPDGKEQLVGEAVAWAGDFAAERVRAHERAMRRPTPGRLLAAVVGDWVRELEARDFERGCPVAAAVVDRADRSDRTRAAAAAALDAWHRPLRDALVAMGVPGRRARDHATLVLCALEGAIVLARAQRSTAPLRTVVRELSPVLDAAVARRPARTLASG